ncbi:RluA family pseudouridine synthase [Opitutus terrae]|uniref:Pseudouridine synthase n=1 Tax=Opitutus terrae (strain DSM 11246 / JCM 15787 / PB90-1) TaxID=452637 RepID=B1ZUV5_OPITP|nr:RluA family pseudouridine synthase [Opitutus terrae]ACB75925.1 pseudouridine synthase [Opitutus terrae PB90-1]
MIPDPSPGGPLPEIMSRRACAWPRRMQQGPARLITAEELRTWIVHEDERLLVVAKPGDVVCHPSKAGPWSSLVGAVREFTGLATVHLVFRLDRETSGIVVLAKDPKTASRLQVAMQERKIGKAYVAILTGAMREPVTVDQPLGDDVASPVFVKSAVRADGQRSVTHFSPITVAADDAFSLVRVVTETGRKHQIRAHAQWLGHSLVGDKIYGPDARCYLDFIDTGWTPALADKLLLPRQALHCAEIDLTRTGLAHVFRAPMAEDMRRFCAERGIVAPAEL